MGQIKKAKYNINNGTDFDTLHFETEASMVKTAGGSDVETELTKVVRKDQNAEIIGTIAATRNVNNKKYMFAIGVDYNGNGYIDFTENGATKSLLSFNATDGSILKNFASRVLTEEDLMGAIQPTGLQLYPSGLMEQWGSISVPAGSGGLEVELLVAYDSFYKVFTQVYGQTPAIVNVIPIDNTKFKIVHNSTATIEIHWVAKGHGVMY